jgi:Leucine-rich repeat (LRR) protein
MFCRSSSGNERSDQVDEHVVRWRRRVALALLVAGFVAWVACCVRIAKQMVRAIDFGSLTTLSVPGTILLTPEPDEYGEPAFREDVDLSLLRYTRGIRALYLQHTSITDADLNHLSSLTDLDTLRLSGTRITGEGLLNLAALDQLEWLDLSETHVDDAGMRLLPELPSLRQLDLGRELTWTFRLTDGSADVLLRFAALESVDLSYNDVGDITGGRLSELSELRRVGLRSCTQITDRSAVSLSHCRNIEVLDLSYTSVSDAGVQVLCRLNGLRELLLTGTSVSDVSVDNLSDLTHLARLALERTAISESGIRELRVALPKCDIRSDHTHQDSVEDVFGASSR